MWCKRRQGTKARCHFLFFLLVSFFGCAYRRQQQAKLLIISRLVYYLGHFNRISKDGDEPLGSLSSFGLFSSCVAT